MAEGGHPGSTPGLRCIVKLGGAAITQKDRFETLNDAVLATTAQQLAAVWGAHTPSDSPPRGLIVVHGAGSFGHFQAKQYNVAVGPLSDGRVRLGFVQTRLSVTKLNHTVVSLLAEAGVPAVGISPFAGGWTTASRVVVTGEGTAVKPMLEAQLVPVLHGDGILDNDLGCTILSGDVILRKLSDDLKPAYVVFLTNVAGVYTKPPSEEGAVLVREIEVGEGGDWAVVDPPNLEAVHTDAADHDTTGGMATKIAEAASIAALGVPVLIAEAGTPHALAALQGTVLAREDSSQNGVVDGAKSWVGTLVRAGHCKSKSAE